MTSCLFALGASLACSVLPAHAQYADWNANPPKILPNERPGSGAVFLSGSGRQLPNLSAFAALNSNGSVVTWGSPTNGGNSTAVAGNLTSNVTAVYSTQCAFAALKTNGSVVTWGYDNVGGNSTAVAGNLTSNVTAVYSTSRAFAALKTNGSVVTWGDAGFGGDSATVAGSLNSNVTAVYSNSQAFAALKSNGLVVTWGDPGYGGNSSIYSRLWNGSEFVYSYQDVSGSLASNVASVYSNFFAFAALKNDGSVVTWGDAYNGGNSTGVSTQLSSNVKAVYSNSYAFAALKTNGSVVSWGNSTYGGNSSAVSGNLSSNVTAVYSNPYAFAALKSDGSVVTWGDATKGGNSTAVTGNLTSNVTAVYSNRYAFAALKSDGSVVTWGDANNGGNSSIVYETQEEGLYGPITIYSYTSVADSLSSNVTAVYSNETAFAALKSDGSVVTWGSSYYGGDSASVAGSLSSNVTAVHSNAYAFAALKRDGSIVTWGGMGTGGPTGMGFTSVQSVLYYEPEGTSATASTGNITSTTATLLGEVAREGKSPVTARGFVYALASVADPKIGDPGVAQLADGGSGLGSFSKLLTSLTPNTQYVFRAYAIDGEGTTYSTVENFSTNLPPVIISNGGNTNVSVSVGENSSAASTISATDADADQAITYGIAGGEDASRFAIGSSSGVLTFVAAPDFEAPADANADNVYQVIVAATDNGNPPKSATQTLAVTVTNVADNGVLAVEQPAGTALASGSSVSFGNRTIGQPAELTFTLRSQGEAELLLSSGAVITGAAALNYSLVGSVPSLVVMGGNVTLTVRFTPTASGNRSAILSIPTNDTRPGRSPYTINLTGNGSATPTIASYTSAANQVLGGWVNGGNFTIGSVGTTSPGNNWPSAESPDKVVDANTGTKFLTYRNSNAGVILKPTNSSVVFNRLSLSTANDASERDPASFILYGSSSNLTGNASTNIPISSLTQIASGNVTMLDTRNAGPTVIQFANSVAYTSYVVVFPTVRSTAGNNLMQISEIQLSQGATPPLAVAMADARGGQLSGSNFSFGSIGNSNPGTNWLAGESPDHAMDGNAGTKFAIFRSSGAGLLASPQAGTAPVNTLTLWTANDSPERDPATYQVYGFPTRITQTSGTLAVGNGTLLANGTVTLPADRSSGPVQVDFNNSTAYASYLVVFPTVKNSPSTNLTQISEVQFSYNGVPDFSFPQQVVSLNENSGSQTRAAFASSITAGLGDVGQTVSFSCTNNNNPLFSTQPAIAADGTLTFTTAPDAYGNATVTVVATDNFGRTSEPKTFRLEVAIVPSISRSAGSLGNFTGTTGSASAPQSLTLNARGLSAPLVVTAPAGFEVSTDNSTFSSSLTLGTKAGFIESVYGGNFNIASGKIWPAGNGQEHPNPVAFAAITSHGSVVTWGNANNGGNASAVAASLTSNVQAVYSNQSAFAALKTDGSVVTWGLAVNGGNSTSVAGSLSSNVTAVYSTQQAFAALKADGSVVTWGSAANGGDSSSVAGNLTSNVTAMYSNRAAFAALKTNGSVVTWGDAYNGGDSTALAGSLTSNVTAVYSTSNAFAALKTNGSVVTWGYADYGGNSTAVAGSLSSNVTDVYSTNNAFAALKTNGSVVTWGLADYGGNSTAVAASLSSNVTAVYSTLSAFAALKTDGSVVTWGFATHGGNSTNVSGGNLTSNVTAVYSSGYAFAALKTNGSVITWGYDGYGGNSTAVAASLTSNVQAVYSNQYAFAALKTDGSVVTWGDPSYGGNSTAVADKLRSNVTAVYSNNRAFAALKTDGSVVTWGDAANGGTGGPASIGININAIPATLYTRLASTAPAGSVSGNLTLTSSGAGNQTVALSGFVNGKPDFSLPLRPVSLNENSGAQSNAAFATGITAGLGDVDQTVSFACTNNNNALFSAQPAISADGTLTFTTAPDAYGNATVSVVATDNLGLASEPKTFRVEVAIVPSIIPSAGSLGNFTTAPGNASAAQSFTVNGRSLLGPVTLIAPTGFEISTDNSTFSSSLRVNNAGTIQTVYRGAFGDYTTASGKIWTAGSGGEFPNTLAFAALKADGSVVTWGYGGNGGNSTSVSGNLSSNVTAVYSTDSAFAALKADGSVVTWGGSITGGDSRSVSGNLSSNVTAVYSTKYAFAALKTDGSVVTWGNANNGGNSTDVSGSLSSNVTAVYSTDSAFAALKDNGSLVTWGNATNGGNSTAVSGSLSSNVTAVYSTYFAFAALKTNGSVITWGNAAVGGNSTDVSGSLSSNVTAVYSNPSAFAALKTDGSVVTWGHAAMGGNSTSVSGNLSSNVTAVYSTSRAFAALKTDGSVVTWGFALWGGNSTAVAGNLSSNVTAVYSNQNAFAALKTDGSVVTWGDAANGGNSTSVSGNLSSNVTAVYSTQFAFAALKSDGSVVTWGNATYGGNSTSVSGNLSSNVTAVYSTVAAFAALKTDGSVVTWGDPQNGGSGGPANIGAGVPIPATIYTRIASTAPAGSVSGNLTLTSSGVTTQSVALSGTVGSTASLATLATTPVSSSIRTTTATLGGEVTADGGAAITARGVVYSLTATDSDPQVGVSGVTNLPATGTAGVFSVNATALTPGAAYTFKAYATNSAGTSYSAAGTFTALRPVEGWRLSNFGDVANSGTGANSASPAGDGIPNLVKYALCLDPAQWGGLPQPEISNNRLKMSFQRDPARSDITITVEGTSDLVNAPWVPVATSTTGGAFSGNGSVSETPLQGGLQQVEVSDSVDTLTDPRRRFLRIRTTLPAE
jgi:hypothetical protein